MAVEFFGNHVHGCGSVIVRLRLVSWRRRGGDVVDGDEFNGRSGLNDRGSSTEGMNLLRAFQNVRRLGVVVPSRLSDGVERIQEHLYAYPR